MRVTRLDGIDIHQGFLSPSPPSSARTFFLVLTDTVTQLSNLEINPERKKTTIILLSVISSDLNLLRSTCLLLTCLKTLCNH